VFSNVRKWSVNCLFPILFLAVSIVVPTFSFAQEQTEREVVVLAINDVYRIEGVESGQRGGMSLVRALRRQLEQQNSDLLVLHAGDDPGALGLGLGCGPCEGEFLGREESDQIGRAHV
jgi:hypothetical protein